MGLPVLRQLRPDAGRMSAHQVAGPELHRLSASCAARFPRRTMPSRVCVSLSTAPATSYKAAPQI